MKFFRGNKNLVQIGQNTWGTAHNMKR